VISATGNILGLGKQTSISLDSTFYTPSDLVIDNSSVGAPYTSHAGLDPASRGQLVPIYSLSGGDSASNRATGGFLDKLAKVPVPLPPMPGMEVFDSIGDDLHALRAPVGKVAMKKKIFLVKRRRQAGKESALKYSNYDNALQLVSSS
jgi:hypothetical protein